jgi:hypothetical protein
MTETKDMLANMTACSMDQAQYKVDLIFNTSKRIVMVSYYLQPFGTNEWILQYFEEKCWVFRTQSRKGQ